VVFKPASFIGFHTVTENSPRLSSLRPVTAGGFGEGVCRRDSLRGAALNELFMAEDAVSNGGGELVS
jgi:hypothetical protein